MVVLWLHDEKSMINSHLWLCGRVMDCRQNYWGSNLVGHVFFLTRKSKIEDSFLAEKKWNKNQFLEKGVISKCIKKGHITVWQILILKKLMQWSNSENGPVVKGFPQYSDVVSSNLDHSCFFLDLDKYQNDHGRNPPAKESFLKRLGIPQH